MCNDLDTIKIIEDKVNEFVKAGIMFSAYDVTKSLRADGEKVFHRDVRDVVRNMFANGDMGDYGRQNYTLNNGDVTFVYLNENVDDLSNYREDDMSSSVPFVVPSPKAAILAPVAPPATPAVSATTSNEWFMGQDSRGRVCVPADALRKLGVASGKSVFVHVDVFANEIVIDTHSVTPSQETEHRVDKDNNVRIGQTLLQKANLDGKPLKCFFDGNFVVIVEDK